MKVHGIIYKKRFIKSYDRHKRSCILFLELSRSVDINGDKIKVIPIFDKENKIDYKVGESLEVEGEIIFQKITMNNGTFCFHPIPVINVYKSQRLS